MEKEKAHRPGDRKIFAFIGFLLGLGAPIGWFVFRTFHTQRLWLFPWINLELHQSGTLYIYMLIGTVTTFTGFGFFLGRRSDKAKLESDLIKDQLKEVNVLATTDALTGIYNARYLHDHLNLEIESAIRYNLPMTCLMLDIDNFKLINDVHGHPFGDEVLITLATVLKQCVRFVDIVGRLGGEEFLVIMPHTAADTALKIAERIRQSIQDWPFKVNDEKVSITVSIGVGHFPSPIVTNKSTLLKVTDEALYHAKKTGKNHCVLAEARSSGSASISS